jgi:hypothetical protein
MSTGTNHLKDYYPCCAGECLRETEYVSLRRREEPQRREEL